MNNEKKQNKEVRLSVIALILICVLCVSGCSVARPGKRIFNGIKSVAELCTLKCYYHNVAEIKNDGTDLLLGMVNVGYKKAWYEYRGYVEFGIDVGQVKVVSVNDGVVSVKMPEIVVLNTHVDENSIKQVCVDLGAFQKITNEEQVAAYEHAQAEMEQSAESNSNLKNQAEERAKSLLEEYVINVGKNIGEEYTVEFV